LIEDKRDVLNIFITTASSLASDRTTSLLPVFIAQAAFIFAIGAAYWRVIGVLPQLHSWTNAEAYSIAMSAPFLYVVPAVFLGAIIGVSQTETRVPRILNQFREGLSKKGVKDEDVPPRIPFLTPRNPLVEDKPNTLEETTATPTPSPHDPLLQPASDPAPAEETPVTLYQRIIAGGLYAWRPSVFSLRSLHDTWHLRLLASTFVFFSVFVAVFISSRVPPEGFDCRSVAQTALLANWLLAFVLDFVFTAIM